MWNTCSHLCRRMSVSVFQSRKIHFSTGTGAPWRSCLPQRFAVIVQWNRRLRVSRPCLLYQQITSIFVYVVHCGLLLTEICSRFLCSNTCLSGFVPCSPWRSLHNQWRGDVSRRGPVGQEARYSGSHDAMHMCRKWSWRVELRGLFPAQRCVCVCVWVCVCVCVCIADEIKWNNCQL